MNKLLKTYKGSKICRWEGGKIPVGKFISGSVYIHKDYALDVIPEDVYKRALDIALYQGRKFNTIKYNLKTKEVRFDDAKDFDSAREPSPGFFLSVKNNIKRPSYILKFSCNIWHHKWLWVSDDYEGFDVEESYEWSKQWLSLLKESPSGTPEIWESQLESIGLF